MKTAGLHLELVTCHRSIASTNGPFNTVDCVQNYRLTRSISDCNDILIVSDGGVGGSGGGGGGGGSGG